MIHHRIDANLERLFSEIASQRSLAIPFFRDEDEFERQMEIVRSYIDAGEGGLAYEEFIWMLGLCPVNISLLAAIGLIELALINGLKTSDEKDRAFNFTDFSPFCFRKTPNLDGVLKISPLNKQQVAERIEAVLNLIDAQRNTFPPSVDLGRNLNEPLSTIRSLLAADELSLAYEGCVCLLERCPIQVPGSVAVGLIELALTFKFKTHRVEDAEYVWDCDPAPIP